jgi:DNA polymerase sigma
MAMGDSLDLGRKNNGMSFGTIIYTDSNLVNSFFQTRKYFSKTLMANGYDGYKMKSGIGFVYSVLYNFTYSLVSTGSHGVAKGWLLDRADSRVQGCCRWQTAECRAVLNGF